MDHDHGPYPLRGDDGTRYGRPGPLDLEPLSTLLSANRAGCQPCQRTALARIGADALLSTRLCELVGAAVYDLIGTLPMAMVDPLMPDSNIPTQLRRFYWESIRLSPDGTFPAKEMVQHVEGMPPQDRAAAVQAAYDILCRSMDAAQATGLPPKEQPGARKNKPGASGKGRRGRELRRHLDGAHDPLRRAR